MRLALGLAILVLAAAWRVIAVHVPAFSNFAPLMALTFCGAVYFSEKRMWVVPFAALTLSDLYLDYHYSSAFGESWVWPSVAVRLVCFAVALPIGRMVAQNKSWLNLLSGALAASCFFYLATNTDAWIRDPFYFKTLAGWWQAMTVGRPEFPPTLLFFRNTLLSDLLFTGLFAGIMEFAASREPAGIPVRDDEA
jgi:hypothetical protein